MTNIMMVNRRGFECEPSPPPPTRSPQPVPAIGRIDNKIVAVEVEFIYKGSVRVIIESAAGSVLGDIFQLQKKTPISKMKTFG